MNTLPTRTLLFALGIFVLLGATLVSSTGVLKYSQLSAAGTGDCVLDGLTLSSLQTGTFYAARTVMAPQTCANISSSRTCFNGTIYGSSLYQYSTCSQITPNASCTVGSTQIASRQTKVFYMLSQVAPGDSCDSVALARTCTDGVMSGSKEYSKPTCVAQAAGAKTNRIALKEFMPYVRSVSWYPFLSDARGIDTADSYQRLSAEIPTMKADGINTVWFGGVFIWKKLQPTAGVWDETEIARLRQHLDLLKANNMRAIFQLNYVGPGYAPAGVDGCYWMDNPAQLQQWRQFVTELGARLEGYNYMIYYTVFTELDRNCIRQRWPYFYPGERLLSSVEMQSGQYAGDSITIPDTPENQANHTRDVRAANQVLKASIGRFSKPEYTPAAVRDLMFIGLHDSIMAGGLLTDDGPLENPINFDYLSFPYYPTWTQLASFPTDANATQVAERSRGYQYVINELDTQVARIRRLYTDATPVLLGEFGWPSWDVATAKPLAKQNSPARELAHEALIDWSVTRHTGINIWGWTVRYLEDPQKGAQDSYEEALALKLRDGSLSSALSTIRNKLLGN